ncbi:hypothetical protein LCGC14_1393450 [marine sediment metagenome]|uniref:Uncharacterized protein n=2 Tax=marine sediment metagenome TaxID=412755 RepID=A0A0F9JZ86_9ZZZZ
MKNQDLKVYVTNKGGHSYEAAEKYGEIIYITEGTLNRFATNTLYRAFIDGMKDSQPDDYILITSMSIVNAIGAAVFARKHGCLNLLLYRSGEYVLREIDIDSLIVQEEEESGEET